MSTKTESIFDDALGDETDEVVFLSADNKDDLLGRFAKPYFFDREPGRKREGFMVRMAPIDTLTRYQRLAEKKTVGNELFRAVCALIADSIVDPDGNSVWSKEQIEAVGKSNAPRFMKMQEAVLDRNNLKKMESLIEDEEKN